MVVKGADNYNTAEASDQKTQAALRNAVAIRAIDEKTFEMTLTAPAPYVTDMLAHPAFAILPMHAIGKFGREWATPGNLVCNGPYTPAEWEPRQQITVVKNENYWDKERVYINSLRFLASEDPVGCYQAYKNGDIDWISSLSFPVDFIDEARLRPDYQVSPMIATSYYIFNMTRPPVSDPRVRKALAIALDTRELVTTVTAGGEQAATSLVPTLPGYTPAAGNAYNLVEAKRLLAKAGFPDGVGFPPLTVIYNTSDRHKTIAEWVRRQWKDSLGIEIKLQNIEWRSFLDVRSARHDFYIARAGWIADYPDPASFLHMFVSDSGNNDGRYNNPTYDKLVEKAATQIGAERMATLRQAEELLITGDQAVIPFFFYVNQDMINLDRIGGWYPNPVGAHPYVGLQRK